VQLLKNRVPGFVGLLWLGSGRLSVCFTACLLEEVLFESLYATFWGFTGYEDFNCIEGGINL
jgi:hypothetical protein